MGEFTKGFSRGLGYGAAKQVFDIAEGVTNIYQNNKIKNIQENTSNGYLRQPTELSVWFYVLAVLTIPYCFIWIPIYGIIRFFKKNTKVSYVENKVVNIPDKRYSIRYRTEYVTQIKSIKVEADDEEIKIYKKQGKWLTIPFIIVVLFSFIILLIV